MATIPKKVVDRFIKNIPNYQKILKSASDRDVNESDTVAIITDILSDIFGYDKYTEVTSELAVRGTYCDLAIRYDDKIHFLIEAKAVSVELKDTHVKQAIDYGANKGIEWVMLTNGMYWKLFKIRLEQKIEYDIVCEFNVLNINPKSDKDQEYLFIITKEGQKKSAREEFFEKVQSINKYMIGSLIMSEPVVAVVRRELRKIADGIRVDQEDVEQIIREEVLKRAVIEGDDAQIAQTKVAKYYRKVNLAKQRAMKQKNES